MVEQELEVLKDEIHNVTILSKSMAEFVLKASHGVEVDEGTETDESGVPQLTDASTES